MNDAVLNAELISLAQSARRGVSKMERFRSLYPSIELALRSGRPRKEVLLLLNKGGLPLSDASFKSCLQRARAEKRGDLNTQIESRRDGGEAPNTPVGPRSRIDGCESDATEGTEDSRGRTTDAARDVLAAPVVLNVNPIETVHRGPIESVAGIFLIGSTKASDCI